MTSRNFEFIHYLLQLQQCCIEQKSGHKEYIKIETLKSKNSFRVKKDLFVFCKINSFYDQNIYEHNFNLIINDSLLFNST